jgi:hypothetical protein
MEKNGENFWGRPGPTKSCRASDDDDDDDDEEYMFWVIV